MPDKVANLGKVHCKIRLYNKLPNLVVNPNKVRKTGSFVMTFQDETNISRKGFGTQFISTHNNVASGAIPQPCYEPVDNFINSASSSTDTTTRPVYWTKLEWNNINPLFKSLITTKPGSSTATKPDDTDLTPGIFSEEPQPVSLIKYNEQYYKDSLLGFRLSSTTTAGSGGGSGSGSGSGPSITTPALRSFVYQKNTNTKGVWWGIEPTSDFRISGGAFWVSIKPTSNFLPDSSSAGSAVWIGIGIVLDDNTSAYSLPAAGGSGSGSSSGSGGSSGSGNNNPWFFLMINNLGQVFLRYQRGGEVINIPVNLPHLSDRLTRGGNSDPFKVGFLVVCGRLVIYSDDDRYDVIDINKIEGKNSQLYAGFDLSKPCPTVDYKKVQVYGYGCTAYVNVCEMTFFKKCWFILESMSGDEQYRGYKSPSDISPTYATGALVEWNIPKEQYENNGNRPMYAAQFHHYYEQDLVSAYSLSRTCDAEETYATINGAKRRWGDIWVVRSPPIAGVSSAVASAGISGRFWFCYMETEDITDSRGTHKNVGFPILYDLFGQQPSDNTSATAATMEDFTYSDISDDIISVNIEVALDDNQKLSLIQRTASVVIYDSEINGNEYHQYLYKARGIKIWLKWGTSASTINPLTDEPVFAGVAFGERATIQPGREAIVLTCYDYWKVFDSIEIKNSPFYDGFELVSVIRDLAERAGIKTPINDLVDHTTVGYHFLGSGFSFDKPSFRFDGAEKIKNCITKAIQSFPYYIWFDNNCVLNVGVIPGDFDWSRTWDANSTATYYRYLDDITPDTYYKLILNEVTMTSTLSNSLYNVFLLVGVDRSTNQPWYKFDNNPISLGLTNQPDSVGYLGYISEFRLEQPAMDSASAEVFLQRYRKMLSKPGYETSCQTIGHIPVFRPGQFILIKQTNIAPDKKFRVTSISHAYTAERNEWYTTISAYQIQSITFQPVTTVPPPP